MNPSELDALVARANAAGFSTVPEYAVALEDAAREWIDAEFPGEALDGPWWDARDKVASMIPLRKPWRA